MLGMRLLVWVLQLWVVFFLGSCLDVDKDVSMGSTMLNESSGVLNVGSTFADFDIYGLVTDRACFFGSFFTGCWVCFGLVYLPA